MVNAPVVLLYASGPDAESAVSPILPLIAVSWVVFVPWSFWMDWSIESVAETVPAPAMNPVSGDAMARALVK